MKQSPATRARNRSLAEQAVERDWELLRELTDSPDLSVAERARLHGVSRQWMHALIARAQRRGSQGGSRA